MTWRRASRSHRAFFLTCQTGCSSRRLVTLRCGDRTCPDCRRKDYYRLRDKYEPALRQIHRPKLITLTLVNYCELTREGVSRLREYMKALFDHFEGIIRGGLYSIEVTNKGRGWHVHVHVLADADFIPHGDLSRLWLDITGNSFIVDVRAADSPDRALRYLLKYLTEEPDLGEDDALEANRRTFNEALKGVRLIHAFGSLYAYRPPDVSRSCPTCGCREWKLISILYEWPDGIFATDPAPDEQDTPP